MVNKYGLMIILLGIFLCGSCMPVRIIKSTDCFYDAIVIGQDNRRCGCCGGWFIDVEGNRYLTDSIPNVIAVLGEPEGRTFPVQVRMNYVKEFSCEGRIIITCIKKD